MRTFKLIMDESQRKIDENRRVTCIACGKLIAYGTMILGTIKILCKCGIVNTLGAEKIQPESQREILN